MWRTSDGERMRSVTNLMPLASSSASTVWVVTFWSMTRREGQLPVSERQCSAKTSTSRAWVSFLRSALA